MIAILDYQAGNQTSVYRALKYLGQEAEITADPKLIQKAQGLIFPGVGAAGQAMSYLKANNLDKILAQAVAEQKPLLGLCLGCQILLEQSQENNTQCLGLISGTCKTFAKNLKDENNDKICIPHMGWNKVHFAQDNLLFNGIEQDSQFYFVHSYYVEVPENLTLASSMHGQKFCAVYGYDGLWAVQFHPEKSGQAGLKLLQNFCNYSNRC